MGAEIIRLSWSDETDCVTETLEARGNMSAAIETWSYAGHVVIEINDGDYAADIHMTMEAVEQHVAHLQQQIAAAKQLAGSSVLN